MQATYWNSNKILYLNAKIIIIKLQKIGKIVNKTASLLPGSIRQSCLGVISNSNKATIFPMELERKYKVIYISITALKCTSRP